MISRTLRLIPPATAVAAMFVLGGAAEAVANSIHPAPTCVEPSPCAPISVMTLLLILVKVFSLV